MERALFISHPKDLEFFEDNYSRLYFGIEFCQNLIPNQSELDEVLNFVEAHSIDFSFVTPYVTNHGLETLLALFTQIAGSIKECEIIFNDWGVFSLIHRQFPHFHLVLGRLLTKIKRDPRIAFLQDRLTPQVLDYFQTTNLSSSWYRQFLIENRIERVELDMPLQGINVDFSDIHKSLYSPYGYITTTRLCLTANCDKPENWNLIGVFPCERECQQYTFHLRNEVMPMKIIRKGNTIFYKNEINSMDQFDRLVYQPKIPI